LNNSGFDKITVNDINIFCNELEQKIFSKSILSINIHEKHNDLYDVKFLKIKSDNILKTEQIIKELIPLEVLEKTGMTIEELEKYSKDFSKEVKDIFFQKSLNLPIEKKKETNIIKTVKFFNNEIPKNIKDDIFKYLEEIEYNNVVFDKINCEELGENIIKTFYIWNESSNKQEPLTEFRSKLESCILTKDLIILKYKKEEELQEPKNEEKWDISFE